MCGTFVIFTSIDWTTDAPSEDSTYCTWLVGISIPRLHLSQEDWAVLTDQQVDTLFVQLHFDVSQMRVPLFYLVHIKRRQMITNF